MKDFNDYLLHVKEMRKILASEETQQLTREIRSKGNKPRYVPSFELPIYPTHDNQLLFTDLNVEDLTCMMENLGFKVSGERTSENSRWDWHTKGLFKQYSMRYGEQGISAAVGYDPATIYFASLDKEVVETTIGLKVESPEVEFLGKRLTPDNEPRLITSIPLSSFVTLHPNDATPQQSEDVVIKLLEQTVERNANGFYGGFKSQRGVLHQVK
ncbi:hypothetical protein HOE37_03455 [Candidatus Woesearchaeota archaeon]|jgi:hypothetical protein|nr:hypothetical protein [Candidatus Woesearchaeota archaeon]MBT4110887.1 hypothetical protein [Candidatus Woesearchaeota archaeon]MBT4336601.1 hypothetical protein [Candidatus Woesearchaeota archaeon]MBT4469650.1 hypothetical protein [Candidatus Woesearchaeota archaeon]MBT6744012.1 hypothetical protein [Candidatus Woesearchaeota archaeon]